MSKQRVSCALAILLVSIASSARATTGAFTGPLTGAGILSVDMNGGPITSAQATTEGWNGSAVVPDSFGVTWSPWGGPGAAFNSGNTGGDSTQLPSSQSGPNVSANSINKTFGAITATLSINVATNSGSYAQVGGAASMNSRDRGTPSGPANDGDLFRDLVFAGTSGSNVQGTNYLKLQFSGLTPGGIYKVATYSFDTTGAHTTNWTATAPAQQLALTGWFDGPSNNNTFAAPADEQSISWTGGTATQAPAIFTLTADAGGTLAVYGFGGNGVSGNQSSDTSYVNGFQIAAVPEASSFVLGGAVCGLVGLTYIARRKHKKQPTA